MSIQIRIDSLFAAIACATLIVPSTQAQAFEEHQIKAGILYNFAKFVEWPPEAFRNADDPIEVCLLGPHPMNLHMEQVVQGRKVANRALAVRYVLDAQQASTCHILFISASAWDPSGTLLEQLREFNILTVGETDDFIAKGGVISFRLKDSHIQIEINRSAAGRARLQISSKLLSLAQIVKK